MAIEIGVVEDVQLDAFGTPPQEEKRELGRADNVFGDEVVETVREGSLHLKFLDNTDFRLGSSAKVQLDKFVYDPNAKVGELGVNLGQGIFRMVTGDMPSEAITINTPIATMGVRGTDWVGLLTANAFIVFVVKGSIWVKPLFGDNIQEYIVNALETVSVSLSGRVTFGVDIPEYDPGLGVDLVELMTVPQAGAEPLGPGGDDIFSGGSLLPFNPANLFRLVQVILERSAPNDDGGGAELPEEFAFVFAPGVSTDSNILFNAIVDTTVGGTPALAVQETPVTPVAVVILVPTADGGVTPVVLTIAPAETPDAGTVVPDPGPGPGVIFELFTPDDDPFTPGNSIDLNDIPDILFRTGFADEDAFLDAVGLGFNITDALSGDDSVILPDLGQVLNDFLDGVLFDAGQGDDTVQGGDAGDLISGGQGSSDTLLGGDGDDELFGDQDFGSTVVATAMTTGDVTVTRDDDTLEGEADSDALYGDNGGSLGALNQNPAVTIAIVGGDDVLNGGTEADTLFGDAGINLVATNLGAEAYGGADTLYGDNNTVVGSEIPGDDVLYGDAGNDILAGNDVLTANGGTAIGGNDVLYGGGDDDVDMFGTLINEDDVLYGDAGGDIKADGNGALAAGGDDSLYGLAGSDVLYGDAGGSIAATNSGSADGGDDLLYGQTGFNENTEVEDVLYGDAGLNLTADGTGSAVTGGDDEIYGSISSSTLFGDAGNDIAATSGGQAMGGNDFLYGEAESDEFVDNILYGDAGGNISADGAGSTAAGGSDTLAGLDVSKADTLYGDAGGDLSSTDDGMALGGNDVVFAGGSDDVIYGDAGGSLIAGTGGDSIGGNDLLYGGGNADTIYGDAGGDITIDNTGDGTVRGGDDTAYGSFGEDVIYGDAGGILSSGSDGNADGGNDVLYGGGSDDTIYGDSGGDDGGLGGNDTLYGDVAEDTLYGGSGNDTLYGDGLDSTGQEVAGMDVLNGGTGIDTLFGGLEEDTVAGGMDSDTLSGGDGADRFLWELGDDDGAIDTIIDFLVSASTDQDILDFQDIVDLSGGNLSDFIMSSQGGGNTTLTIDPDGTGTGSGTTLTVVLLNVLTDVATLDGNGQIVVTP